MNWLVVRSADWALASTNAASASTEPARAALMSAPRRNPVKIGMLAPAFTFKEP